MDDAYGEREVKLPAGELILYPSTTLHRVDPVTSGVRLAAIIPPPSQTQTPGTSPNATNAISATIGRRR